MKTNITLITGFFAGFFTCTLIVIIIEVMNPPQPHQIKARLQGSHDNIVWFTIDSLLIPTK